MKQCPKCERCYLDSTLNFCLEDGEPLRDYVQMSDFPTEVMPHSFGVSESRTKLFSAGPSGEAAYAPPDTVSRRLNSIAVLPFTHMSSDPDDEYFCDGLAEELINALAKIDDLKVAARTSAFSFKGKNVDIAAIGRQLGVENVLEGSVRKSGNRLRITAQLIGTSDGYHIWSERYDREMRDVFEIQDEITLAVTIALKSKLFGTAENDQLALLLQELKSHSNDVEAYNLYLRGRFYINKFTTADAFRAVELFEQAIELDSSFAPAYAGLADALIMLTEMGPMAPHESMPKAKTAALKAIELDESLAEGHSSLGMVLQVYDYDFAGAEEQFQRAIKLSPNNPIPRQSYAVLLTELERLDEADHQFKRLLEVDPLSPVSNWIYSFCLFLSRRYDAALERANATLDLDPNFGVVYLSVAFAYQMKGEHRLSVDAYARWSEVMGSPENAAYIRDSFQGGWENFLRAMTDEKRTVTFSSYITAVFHATLGNTDAAIANLETSLQKRESHMVMLKSDPRFDAIRNDPRFRELLSKAGFPEDSIQRNGA
ncbi:MAG: hypothetical protein HOP17_05045 [Acidobacteria bacterium]|nr:hypothetical protein [Acidobacteriota bacterium]